MHNINMQTLNWFIPTDLRHVEIFHETFQAEKNFMKFYNTTYCTDKEWMPHSSNHDRTCNNGLSASRTLSTRYRTTFEQHAQCKCSLKIVESKVGEGPWGRPPPSGYG